MSRSQMNQWDNNLRVLTIRVVRFLTVHGLYTIAIYIVLIP